MPAAPRQEDSTWWQADWSARLLVVFQGERYTRQGRRRTPENLKQAKILGENSAGRETFLEKGSPSPCPTLPKTFAGGPVQRWKSPQRGRTAAIPQGHVMARQEAEFMAREGRDIRQGIAGAGQADRIEACHLAGHRRHICAEELPKSPRRVWPPEGEWSCTKRRGAARARVPDVAGLAARPDTAGARWTGCREAAESLANRRTLAGQGDFGNRPSPGQLSVPVTS